jgi:tetratricopeptide (TPR) repeat protein
MFTRWHDPACRWEIVPLSLFVKHIVDRHEVGAHRLAASLGQWLPNADASDFPVRLLTDCILLEKSCASISLSDTIMTRTSLGWALRQRGQLEKAETLLREAVQLCRSSNVGTTPEFATSLNNLAKSLLHAGRAKEALPLFREALEMSQNAAGMDTPTTATFMNNLADALISLGALTEAQDLVQKAIAIRIQYFGEEDPHVAVSHSSLARLYLLAKNYEESETHSTTAIKMLIHFYGRKHFRVADAMQMRAESLAATGKSFEALAVFNDVLAIRREVLPPEHPDTQRTLNCLSNINKT